MTESFCRFVLTDVKESEIRQEIGYDVFEPTVEIEINEKKVFSSSGAKGAEPVVIMHFREDALTETRQLLNNYDQDPGREDDYEYWFHGTGCGLKLKRQGAQLDLSLDVDWGCGPASNLDPGIYPMGQIAVRDWVEAIVGLSKELSDWFRRLNPQLFGYIKNQELWIQELESRLISQGP